MVSTISLRTIREFEASKVSEVEGQPDTLVISANSHYIHIDDFKRLFEYAGQLVKERGIKKLVFDKRRLTAFHQPSMEWYFIEWKDQMFDLGLKTHRKILPDNNVFKMAVKAGREKLGEKYPNAKFHQMDIQYSQSLEEALES
jgi:hypothetical protein